MPASEYIWVPQEGPQTDGYICPCDQILYGGARGGGKTDCSLGRHLRGMDQWARHWKGLLIRMGYKNFPEIRARINDFIADGLPATLKGGDSQTNFLVHKNGGSLMIAVVDSAQKLDDFMGQQFTEITVEEACQFPFIDTVVDRMQGCLRSPHGVPCTLFMTANPGGPGHAYLKREFIDPDKRGYKVMTKTIGETVKMQIEAMFIPSSVYDNRVLVENDPMYLARLESIRDPAIREAWLHGNWDVVAGGFFADVWRPNYNVVRKFIPPKHWQRIMGFDWGSARPFSVGWYAVADGSKPKGVPKHFRRGALIRYAEWYGCAKGQMNVGLRYESPMVAERILEMEVARSEDKLYWDRIADPSIFSSDDGPAVSERMANKRVVFRPADNKRIPGWDEMRYRLRPDMDDETEPLLYITENCRHFIDIIPTLPRDENNWEDLDTDAEDHIADEVRYVCMSRPQIQTKTDYERLQDEDDRENWEDTVLDPVAGY